MLGWNPFDIYEYKTHQIYQFNLSIWSKQRKLMSQNFKFCQSIHKTDHAVH